MSKYQWIVLSFSTVFTAVLTGFNWVRLVRIEKMLKGEPMTQSETQERVKQIRERHAQQPPSSMTMREWSDIDFLLSLIDTRAPVDSQVAGILPSGHHDGFIQGYCDAATQMHNACVETIRALRPAATGAGAFKDAAITALSSLTLDQVKQEKESK